MSHKKFKPQNQEVSTTWTFNGVSLEFDVGDLESIEKWEKESTEFAEKEKECMKVGKTVDILREKVKLFHEYFDNIFGPGTSGKLFAGKDNIRLCIDAYISFNTFASKQSDMIHKKQNDFVEYSRQRKAAVK